MSNETQTYGVIASISLSRMMQLLKCNFGIPRLFLKRSYIRDWLNLTLDNF